MTCRDAAARQLMARAPPGQDPRCGPGLLGPHIPSAVLPRAASWTCLISVLPQTAGSLPADRLVCLVTCVPLPHGTLSEACL